MNSLPLSSIQEQLVDAGIAASLVGSSDPTVSQISVSSTAVERGALFVAIPGTTTDGHRFVADALQRGAVAAVVSDPAVLAGAPGIVVKEPRRALSLIAALVEGFPGRAVTTIGITGTNGKTTTNWLIYQALRKLGRGAIRLGTIGIEASDSSGKILITDPGALTTPDPISLHQQLRRAVDGGVKYCVIEAGSHGLDQHRIDHLDTSVAVFTNLTRDHLDYHGTMERYFAAKRRLFELACSSSKEGKAMVCNLDTESGRVLRKEFEMQLADLCYGSTQDAMVRVVEFVDGQRLVLSLFGKEFTITTPLMGGYNGQNLLAAFSALVAAGIDLQAAAEALSGVAAAPGRLDKIEGRGLKVFIDYAHTPDALERALQALRPIVGSHKLRVLFGCGGDRDAGKRPQMGAIAARLADIVWVTSDNPRTEDPQLIITQILAGVPASARTRVSSELDRRTAIENLLGEARHGDVVLIAGKGHEDYQVLGKQKVPFSDHAVVNAALGVRAGNR